MRKILRNQEVVDEAIGYSQAQPVSMPRNYGNLQVASNSIAMGRFGEIDKARQSLSRLAGGFKGDNRGGTMSSISGNFSVNKMKNVSGSTLTDGDVVILGSYIAGTTAKVLVIAGGGGSGGAANPFPSGGGGAGEYVYNASFVLSTGAYSVVVGTGGAGGASDAVGTVGNNSTFSTITSLGGGYGGGKQNAGGNGGSAGGAGSQGNPLGGTATASQGLGNNGGSGQEGARQSGAGGGSAGAGGNGGAGQAAAGIGTANSISGASVTYSVGGQGATESASGATSNTAGSGGGGRQGNLSEAGVSGKNGTVIISYVTADFGACTGGTITTDGANTVHTFTTNGTFTAVLLSDATNGDEVSTTVVAGNTKVFGMVMETIADQDYGMILVQGYTKSLKVNGTTNIAVGDFLSTFTSAGISRKASAGDMVFAYALEAYIADDSSGVIDAQLISPRLI